MSINDRTGVLSHQRVNEDDREKMIISEKHLRHIEGGKQTRRQPGDEARTSARKNTIGEFVGGSIY